jgi:hypothetical protein
MPNFRAAKTAYNSILRNVEGIFAKFLEVTPARLNGLLRTTFASAGRAASAAASIVGKATADLRFSVKLS